MKAFFIALLSDEQNRPDEQAIISILGAAVFFGLEIFSVVRRGQTFDPVSFGAGMGALLGAATAGFGLRARLSPMPPAGSNLGHFIGDTNAADLH